MLPKKAWNLLGFYTREEAIELLTERLVSQKRRVLMRDCVRIIYYCHVQRSSGCRYEISVCIPNDSNEKLRIEDFNVHTCDPTNARMRRRRSKPQIEAFDKPFQRRRPVGVADDAKEGTDSPFTFNESMRNFLNGITDRIEMENDLEICDDSCGFKSAVATSSENLTKFVSEFEESLKPCNPTKPSQSNVWETVDVDVVDFSKRPHPPFTHVFHAKDEATHYSYACPMVGSHAEVVADALLNLFFQYGPPNTVKLDSIYRGTTLESRIAAMFPSTSLLFRMENRNKQGAVVPRREEIMIRERIYAWLMENGKLNWCKHLNEIKFMHNSEWLEELGGTPIELFFGRPRSIGNSRKRKADGDLEDDTLSDTYTTNSNDARDEQSMVEMREGEISLYMRAPKREF